MIECFCVCLLNQNCTLVSYQSSECKLFNALFLQHLIPSPNSSLYQIKSENKSIFSLESTGSTTESLTSTVSSTTTISTTTLITVSSTESTTTSSTTTTTTDGFDSNNGLQNYWPIINDVTDKVSNANMYDGSSVSFTQDRFNRSNQAIDLNYGYYRLPPGSYICGDFTFALWAYFREQTMNGNRILDIGNIGDQTSDDALIFVYSAGSQPMPGFIVFNGNKNESSSTNNSSYNNNNNGCVFYNNSQNNFNNNMSNSGNISGGFNNCSNCFYNMTNMNGTAFNNCSNCNLILSNNNTFFNNCMNNNNSMNNCIIQQ